MAGRFNRAAVGDELQEELRDLLSLAVVGDHVRWVLSGDEVDEFAHWLVEAVGQWRAWADQVARGLASLGVAPDGRVRALATDVPMNWVPDGWLQLDEAQRLLGNRVMKMAEWARYRESQATHPGILELLHVVSSGLEAQMATLQTVN